LKKENGKEMINLKPQRFSEPSMLFFVKDPPNIVSLAGLLCALFGIYFAILGKFSFAIIVVLWAIVCDYADGIIARKTKGRTNNQRAIGSQLDSLIDIVSFGVFPAVFLLSYGKFNPWFLPGAFLMIDEKTYKGLAIDKNVLILAFLFLFERFFNHTLFSIILYAILMIMLVFNLASHKYL